MIKEPIKSPDFFTCKNCDEAFTGEFCNYCGQKNIKGKLSAREIFTGISSSFNLEKGFYRTFRELIYCPDVAITNFLRGKRKGYYNPVKFFLIALTLNVFFASIFHEGPQKNLEIMNSPLWVFLNLLLLVPLLSLFSKFLSKKFSYIENMVVNLYGLAMTIFLSTTFLLLYQAVKTTGYDNENLQEISYYIIRVGFLTWLYSRVFKKNFWFTLLYSFVAYFSIFVVLYIVLVLLFRESF